MNIRPRLSGVRLLLLGAPLLLAGCSSMSGLSGQASLRSIGLAAVAACR